MGVVNVCDGVVCDVMTGTCTCTCTHCRCVQCMYMYMCTVYVHVIGVVCDGVVHVCDGCT